MRDRKLATRYARALLSALADPASQERADAFLSALASALADNAELRALLLDPAVAMAVKTRVVHALAQSHDAPPQVLRFLTVVAEHGRLAILSSIAEEFHEDHLRGQGIVTATLTAAAPMTPELEARAAAALAKLSGRTVRLQVEIDPGLLGGASARVGSMLYDGSLRTQLARLRARLAEE